MQVSCASPLAVGSFVWQPRAGAFALTVVCKATYTLQQGVSPLVAAPDEPSFTDIHWQGNPAASVHIPSDLAPFKRRIDVLVSGHVHAPVGPPVRSLVARLRVGTIQKSMAVLGDRFWTPDGRISGPAPFTKMPILWERAEGGRGTWNPVGIPVGLPAGREGPAPLPSFEPVGFVRQTPTQGSMPVGLGPLSPAWPTRTMYLRHHLATWSHDTWYRAPLPADIDPAYFNSAAPDQQLDRLPDWIPIYLENLHPEAPNLGTVLEDIRPRALVTRTTAAPMEIWLRCDTLLIDTDRGTCTLTWRATVPIAGPFEKGMVHVTMTRGRFADAVPGGAPPAEVPVRTFPEAPADEAPVETVRRLEIEDEETTSMVAKAGLVVARGPLLLRYAPPAPAPIADVARSPGTSPAPAGVDAEEVEEVDAEEVEEVDAEEADVDEVATGELDVEEVPTGRVRAGEAATGGVDIEDEETRTSLPEDAPGGLLPPPPAPGLPSAARDEVARTPLVRPAAEEYLPSPGPAMPSPSMGAPFPSAGATLESPGAAFQSPGLPPPSPEGPSRPPTLPLAPSGGPSRPPTLQLPPSANPSRPRTLPFARTEGPSRPPAGSFQSSPALPFQSPGGSFQSPPALPFQSPAGAFQSSAGSFQSPPAPSPSSAEALPPPAPRGPFADEETHKGYSDAPPPVSLPFPKTGAQRGVPPPSPMASADVLTTLPLPMAAGGGAAPLPFRPPAPSAALAGPPPGHGGDRPAPRAMPRSFGPSLDDDVTHTGEGVEVAVEPLPFHSAAPRPRAIVPSIPSPAPPLDGPPPWTPLVALASPEVSSPPGPSLADHVPAHAREEPARAAPPGITLEQYARVKSELWGAEASLPEALARHGIDEIAWRVHERWQADALAAEAREGRCDLALALVAAFESARAVPAEVPFAVVSAGGAP